MRRECLSTISSVLAYFLQENSSSSVADPFLNHLNRMIDEEKLINGMHQSLNGSLETWLEKAKADYKQQYDILQASHSQPTLTSIYENIKLALDMPVIQIQQAAAETYRQRTIELSQHVVRTDKTS